MTNFTNMNRQDQQAYLMKPIIDELKQVGGQATTRDLKRAVVEREDNIPENILTMYKTSRNGRKYLPFNFAISNLIMAGMLKRSKQGILVLTEKGREYKGSRTELSDTVYKISLPQWQKKIEQNKKCKASNVDIREEEALVELEEDWKGPLLNVLLNLSPGKFEFFCRALVAKMNVDIDETIGTSLTGDGGVDGYGYIKTDDFRTARVAIQAKRWNPSNSVSSPEIDKFRGAMDKFRAEYGIFITISTFTRDAIKASRAGTRVITLIDGDHLLELIAKYELYVTKKVITTYELDDFFGDEN